MLHITLPALRKFAKPIVKAFLAADSTLDKDHDGAVIAVVQELIDQGVTSKIKVAVMLHNIVPKLPETETVNVLKKFEGIWWFTNAEGSLQTLPV